MNNNETKSNIKLLEEVMNSFGEISGKPHNKVTREKIATLVKKFTKAPYDFTRTDDKGKRQLNLWWGEVRKSYGMSPDITIAIYDNPEKFYVSDDCLVGTLQGLYEHLQEMKAYEDEMRNEGLH